MDLQAVTAAMIAYDAGDPMRIHHFLKVYAFARLIGLSEGLSADLQEITEVAALVHDIGIHRAEALYGSSAGKYQEELGPAEAEALLYALNASSALTAPGLLSGWSSSYLYQYRRLGLSDFGGSGLPGQSVRGPDSCSSQKTRLYFHFPHRDRQAPVPGAVSGSHQGRISSSGAGKSSAAVHLFPVFSACGKISRSSCARFSSFARSFGKTPSTTASSSRSSS